MAELSKIQWTDHTWNPWHGCKKVSPGCKFCYMYRDKDRYGQDPTTVLRSKSTFYEPLKWQRWAQSIPHRFFNGMRVFTCSWSDFFIEEADRWRGEAWEIIADTPEFIYQILTKRPERIHDHIPKYGLPDNVWIGVSVESYEQIARIGYLTDLPCIRFASFEPLIGPIKYHPLLHHLDWAIIGGESGNDTGKWGYRPCEVRWIDHLSYNLRSAGVPVFIKQLGTHLAKELNLSDRHGGNIDEWDSYLQIREFPRIKV